MTTLRNAQRSTWVALAGLIVVAVATVAGAQEPAWSVADDPTHPDGQLYYSSPIVICDGKPNALPGWSAPQNVRITHTAISMGNDAPAPGAQYPAADMYTTIYASRPHGYILAFGAHDQYAPPSDQHLMERDLKFRMQAGDQIGGGYVCNALFGRTSHMQVLIIVSYTKE